MTSKKRQGKQSKNAEAPAGGGPAATVQLGLAAAIGDGKVEKPDLRLVAIEELDGQREKYDQERFEKEAWQDFVESIRHGGLDYPVIVKPSTTEGRFEIVDGRHRVLAHKTLRLDAVPVQVRRDYTEKTSALAEVRTNLQRAEPAPWDEARAFKRAQQAGATVGEIAKEVGLSESTVRGRLAVSALPDDLGERLANDNGQVALFIAGFKEHDEEAFGLACQAARKQKGYLRMHNLWQAVVNQLHAHKDKYLVVDALYGNDWELGQDPALKKALGTLKGFAVKRGNYSEPFRVCLEPAKAIEAVKAAKERLKVREARSSSRGGRAKGQVDVAGRVRNRLQRLQLDLAVKTIKSAVGFGNPWRHATYRRFLQTGGLIASQKVEKAAMLEVSGMKEWNGRSESLVARMEKLGWDSVEGQRVLAMALHLSAGGYTHVVSDSYAKLTTGTSEAALRARAKREVVAELKKKQEAEKAKKAKGNGKGKGAGKKPTRSKAGKKLTGKKSRARKPAPDDEAAEQEGGEEE